LFFINLGGYKENEFEEYHYKIPNCCTKAWLASKKAKEHFLQTLWFQGSWCLTYRRQIRNRRRRTL
jgi:hypothetical protein